MKKILLILLIVIGGFLIWRAASFYWPKAVKSDLIRVDSPNPQEIIASPLEIKGQARGYWYFEAVFPVKLLDGNGKIIAQDQAHALSEWTTENFVPFQAELNFSAPDTDQGTLVLEKDNPSGMAEKADSVQIPIRFR